MDKLLRSKKLNIQSEQQGYEYDLPEEQVTRQPIVESAPIEALETETDLATYASPANFAHLGAPRERDADEYVPNVILEKQPKPTRMPSPHFKLVSNSEEFKDASKMTMAKYAFVALFVGISVTSFLTQGVLTIKDMVFGPADSSLQLATADTQVVTRINGNETEPLGSDDGATPGNSATTPSTGFEQNQYRLANEASFPKLSARAYLVADLQTGEIIYEQNENLVAPIASVSKLMTAVVAQENMDLQKIAIVSRDSYNTYGAQGRLLLGEKIKVYDLMYPLLMESSNDAAEVISEAYDKGHEAFMALMNKKAIELGMNDTYYEDPSGLNPKNVSSTHDLLKLGRYIYQKHPNLYSMTRVRQYAILKHTWFNQNRYLNYDSFLGGKNGYIDEAKKTTVSLFDVPMARGGKRPVVIVILKSDDREGDAVKIINFLKKNAYYQETVATAESVN